MRGIALLALLPLVASLKGLDSADLISTSQYQCLLSSGYTFFVTRLFRSIGVIDTLGIQNIRLARGAGFNDVGGYIFPCLGTDCPTPENQTILSLGNLQSSEINFVWIEVDFVNDPGDVNYTRDFYTRMVAKVQSLGFNAGIYSNSEKWAKTVGADWQSFGELPLWWAYYNGSPDNEDFTPFGGWTSPLMHQYLRSSDGDCGVYMDPDFKDTL